MPVEQAQVCWEKGRCSLWEETLFIWGSVGGGELGKEEAGPGRGLEAVEEGGYAWDVPPGLGGEEGEVTQGSDE